MEISMKRMREFFFLKRCVLSFVFEMKVLLYKFAQESKLKAQNKSRKLNETKLITIFHYFSLQLFLEKNYYEDNDG